MRLGGLSLVRADPTPGNVLEPQPSGEATHGEWGGSWPRRLTAPAPEQPGPSEMRRTPW